ncbi:DUF1822 family protein [Leptolyngbya sp. AN03gr2]|uniref:DUF1822 family protein n=1 Tax=unclassified Leptolyngbya TaxID=2650499 RepID=UPI003D313A16
MKALKNSPAQPIVDLPGQIVHHALTQSASYRDLETKRRAYLNLIAIDMTVEWLDAIDWANVATATQPMHQNWEAVNGTALALKEKSLIVIPDNRLDSEELVVPEYWTVPSQHQGDYFLFVAIDPNENRFRFVGYTTHKALITEGTYGLNEKGYRLAADQITSDIAVFSVVRQVSPNEVTRYGDQVLTDRAS